MNKFVSALSSQELAYNATANKELAPFTPKTTNNQKSYSPTIKATNNLELSFPTNQATAFCNPSSGHANYGNDIDQKLLCHIHNGNSSDESPSHTSSNDCAIRVCMRQTMLLVLMGELLRADSKCTLRHVLFPCDDFDKKLSHLYAPAANS